MIVICRDAVNVDTTVVQAGGQGRDWVRKDEPIVMIEIDCVLPFTITR